MQRAGVGTVVRFDSVDAFVEQCAKSPLPPRDYSDSYTWDAGVSPKEARKRATAGDPSLVAGVSASLESLALTSSEEVRAMFVPDVYGSRVDVGAYMAGQPNCMRRRVKRETSTRHVGIYVCLPCYAGVSAASMLARGTAILGLLQALTASQVAVDLYLFSDVGSQMGDYTSVIRVESRPLDLSTSGFAIAHPAFTRHAVYDEARDRVGFTGRYSHAYQHAAERGARMGVYETHIRKRLSMLDTDVFVPPCMSNHELAVISPETWIVATVAKSLNHAA